MLHITRIYHEPGVMEYPRAQEISARFPDALYREVSATAMRAEFAGNAGDAARWIEQKRTTLLLALHGEMHTAVNGRSAHWNLPEQSTGCAMACAYCYLSRAHGFAKPMTAYVDIDRLLRYVEGHARRQGMLSRPDQIDERYWVYEIGDMSDCSVDALISENVWDVIRLFRRLPNAMATFATKFVNPEMLRYDPQRKTRIRFSLMPAGAAQVVDLRTDPLEARVRAINDFADAGYDVRVSFAPVIVYDGWLAAYAELFTMMADIIKPRILSSLSADMRFLTHTQAMHELNMGWNATAEALLWNPHRQTAADTSHAEIRYTPQLTRESVQALMQQLRTSLPGLRLHSAL